MSSVPVSGVRFNIDLAPDTIAKLKAESDVTKMNFVFDWDKNKAKTNLAKHKVSFDECKTIFADPFLLTLPDEEHSNTEERFISIGMSANERILLAVHLEKHMLVENTLIRIISCRKATNVERRLYEEGK